MNTTRSASHPAPLQVIEGTPITTDTFFDRFRHPAWARRLCIYLQEIESHPSLREDTEVLVMAVVKIVRENTAKPKLKLIEQEV